MNNQVDSDVSEENTASVFRAEKRMPPPEALRWRQRFHPKVWRLPVVHTALQPGRPTMAFSPTWQAQISCLHDVLLHWHRDKSAFNFIGSMPRLINTYYERQSITIKNSELEKMENWNTFMSYKSWRQLTASMQWPRWKYLWLFVHLEMPYQVRFSQMRTSIISGFRIVSRFASQDICFSISTV